LRVSARRCADKKFVSRVLNGRLINLICHTMIKPSKNAWRNSSTSLKNRGIKFSTSEKPFGTGNASNLQQMSVRVFLIEKFQEEINNE
jgi:hypothetical protein